MCVWERRWKISKPVISSGCENDKEKKNQSQIRENGARADLRRPDIVI